MQNSQRLNRAALLGLTAISCACAPVVKVEAPEKPIVIDMNIKIDHTLKLQLERDVAETIAKKPDIF